MERTIDEQKQTLDRGELRWQEPDFNAESKLITE